jgi:DNA-directed RNA polymerase specialized sigma24 family protein
MATWNHLIECLRTAVQPVRDQITDGELLESFVQHRYPEALAELVHRHGSLVWGVCRRLLRQPQDAEDAFQATFLVLVRKAATIRQQERVAHWLYRVAYQTALNRHPTSGMTSNRCSTGNWTVSQRSTVPSLSCATWRAKPARRRLDN